MSERNEENLRWTRSKSCLLCGFTPCDAHHVVRRSHCGTDDLFNLAPLCRTHHSRFHDGDHQVHAQMEAAVPMYFDFLRLLHKMTKENRATN